MEGGGRCGRNVLALGSQEELSMEADAKCLHHSHHSMRSGRSPDPQIFNDAHRMYSVRALRGLGSPRTDGILRHPRTVSDALPKYSSLGREKTGSLQGEVGEYAKHAKMTSRIIKGLWLNPQRLHSSREAGLAGWGQEASFLFYTLFYLIFFTMYILPFKK